MKKVLIILLIVLPVYLALSLYFLDKRYFFCPVQYGRRLTVRYDDMGEGYFAARRSGGRRLHNGIDLQADVGTAVYAARSGIVVEATESKGMGKYVVIRHPYNLKTIYGHLSEIFTFKGALVRQGQVIGNVGKTGNANYRSMKAHLHFEVKNNGKAEDPLVYLQ